MDVREEATPRFFDTYGAVYAFTAIFAIGAIATIAALPAYAANTGYYLLLAWPPLVAMASLLLTERRPGSWLGLAGRTLLLTSIASLATVLMISFAIPVINLAHARPLLAPRGLPGVTVGVVALVTLIVVPLVIGFVRALRSHDGGSKVRAGAIAVALVLALVVAFMTIVPGYDLVRFLRDDQAYAVLMVISWYGPAYALATASARSLGLG